MRLRQKVYLSDKQIDGLKTTMWLCSDNNESGRSYLIAYCLLGQAINNPGKEVRIFDHFLSNDTKHMRSLIESIASVYDINVCFSFHKSIYVKKIKKEIVHEYWRQTKSEFRSPGKCEEINKQALCWTGYGKAP